jgi:hypothetical protein
MAITSPFDGIIALGQPSDQRSSLSPPRRFLRVRRTAGTAVAVVSAVSYRIAELGGDLAGRFAIGDDEEVEVIELETARTSLSDEMLGAIESAVRQFLRRGESMPNLRRILATA